MREMLNSTLDRRRGVIEDNLSKHQSERVSGITRGEVVTLGNNERRMLRALFESEAGWNLNEILMSLNGPIKSMSGSGQVLGDAGLVQIVESSSRKVSLGSEGHNAVWMDYLNHEFGIGCESQTILSEQCRIVLRFFERHEAGPGVGLLKSLESMLSRPLYG